MTKVLGRDIPIYWPDPDARFCEYLQRWLPAQLAPVFGPDPYLQAGIHRARSPLRELGRLSSSAGQPAQTGIYLCNMVDEQAGFPVWPWQMRPPAYKPNSLWFPTGASRFGLALVWTDWDTIQDAINEPIEWRFSGRFDNGSQSQIFEQTYRLRVLKCLPTIRSDLAMAVLVDRRFQESRQIVELVNPQSWSQIAAALPFASRIQGLVEAPVPPDALAWTRHLPAGMALDAVAACCGQRVKFDADSERYVLQEPSEATNAVNAQAGSKRPRIIGRVDTATRGNLRKLGEVAFSMPWAQPRYLWPSGQRHITPRYGAGMVNLAVYVTQAVREHEGVIYNTGQINQVADYLFSKLSAWYEQAPSYYLSLPPGAGWEATAWDDFTWFVLEQDSQGSYWPKTLVASLPPECFPVEYPIAFPPEPSSSGASSSGASSSGASSSGASSSGASSSGPSSSGASSSGPSSSGPSSSGPSSSAGSSSGNEPLQLVTDVECLDCGIRVTYQDVYLSQEQLGPIRSTVCSICESPSSSGPSSSGP